MIYDRILMIVRRAGVRPAARGETGTQVLRLSAPLRENHPVKTSGSFSDIFWRSVVFGSGMGGASSYGTYENA